ncbi:hypothetical protein B0H14DRAFT_2774229 [Mycena olivaceomarginata]|nr:hypothetical protein B0H14DRAFT_2774229 [Mycena olivaceomarginata]
MPAIRRIDSDTTHVSDSEPEREEARSRARKNRSNRTQTSTPSARRRVHQRAQIPFVDRSNTLHVENEIVDLNAQLRAVLGSVSWSHSPVSSLTFYRASSPSRLDSQHSTCALYDGQKCWWRQPNWRTGFSPRRTQLHRRYYPLQKELDEFEAHVESVEARKHILESTSIP